MAPKQLFLVVLVLIAGILACSLPGKVSTPYAPTVLPVISTWTSQPTAQVLPPTATATEEAQLGTIRGKLSYPSEFIPPQKVVAFVANNLDTFYTVESVLNQGDYELQVPAGTYFVVSYLADGTLAAGYSAMVPCGLKVGCDDHSLLPVTVAAGQTVEAINPADWYASEGTFPPKP
jgi:hypothetical protein